jgi:casein kinase II subunit alpha
MDETFDLLNNMLRVDHTERITAKDSIQHPFFDHVRDQVFEETYSKYLI